MRELWENRHYQVGRQRPNRFECVNAVLRHVLRPLLITDTKGGDSQPTPTEDRMSIHNVVFFIGFTFALFSVVVVAISKFVYFNKKVEVSFNDLSNEIVIGCMLIATVAKYLGW